MLHSSIRRVAGSVPATKRLLFVVAYAANLIAGLCYESDLLNRVCSTWTWKHVVHFPNLALGGYLDQLLSKLFAFLVDESGKRRPPQLSLGVRGEIIGRSGRAEHVEIAVAETAGWIIEIFDSFFSSAFIAATAFSSSAFASAAVPEDCAKAEPVNAISSVANTATTKLRTMALLL